MKKQFELLAPGGDIESIKAAIIAGADAVYCGLDSFNARNRAVNLSFAQLHGVLKLAHKHNCQVFLTLNILILEHEIPALLRLLNELVNTRIDGVIVQDIGLFYLLKQHFTTLDIHASTQMTTHNDGQILFLKKLGASRVNLCRELNISEITSLTSLGHQHQVLSEVFVHGSYCIGFSGLCYISSVYGGNSGNRGRCSQPCRDQYQTTAVGNDYPLNMKDNSAFANAQLLLDAGVDSLKIEGRIKGPSYVYTVVNSWRKQLQRDAQGEALAAQDEDLYQVFNRDFSDGFLRADINQEMFIDNPRDHTLKHIELQNPDLDSNAINQAKQALYEQKIALQKRVETMVSALSVDKTPLTIRIDGREGTPLKALVTTPDNQFEVVSTSVLRRAEQATIDRSAIEKRFKGLNNAQYTIEKLCLANLDDALCIPFKELTALKNKIALLLNDGVELIAPVVLPVSEQAAPLANKPRLSVLIGDPQDISLGQLSNADIYYQLPDSFKKGCTKWVDLFLDNDHLIPWFPAVLIGDDYRVAVEFLEQLQPELIVTNNSGIAYQAYQMGIKWIAGPYLNITNSLAMVNIQEQFACHGAFISNEINRKQISNIRRPDKFKLYYSLYHPLLLMSSRQCFFQQTVGCKKTKIDKNCLQRCAKSTEIINLKGNAFVIDKKKGGYPSIYSDQPFLNTEIVEDLPTFFDGLFVDLTASGTAQASPQDKAQLLQIFAELVAGSAQAKEQLHALIGRSTNGQYKKGL